MESKVKVSICCIAYNQEKYIAQALESFLEQIIDFEYEIIINDDASTDRTAEVIREYEKKYPNIIKAIYQKENQYSKGISTAQIVRNKAKGEYIAFCEGDDFWTDKEKIRDQVKFLDENKEYIAISHWCDIVDEQSKIYEGFKNSDKIFNIKEEEYGLKEYKKDIIPGHINSIMHRNIFLNKTFDYEKMYKSSKRVGDRTTYLILVLLGKVKVEHKKRSVYRFVFKGGESYSAQTYNKNISYEWFEYYTNLEKNSLEVFKRKIKLNNLKYEQLLIAFNKYRREKSVENKEILSMILKNANKGEMIVNIPFAFLYKIKKRRRLREKK